LKDSAENDLMEAIKVVSEGKAFFSPEISKILVEDYVREMRKRGWRIHPAVWYACDNGSSQRRSQATSAF
jgi:DNA-binding NarL/FixJ family response regulator